MFPTRLDPWAIIRKIITKQYHIRSINVQELDMILEYILTATHWE